MPDSSPTPPSPRASAEAHVNELRVPMDSAWRRAAVHAVMDAGEHCAHCLDVNCSRDHAHRPDNPTVSLVIPTKNEARNLPWVLLRVPDVVTEIILVDADSTDGTVDVARHFREDIRVVHQAAPGKGAAMAAGMAAASGDIVVVIDADCSMDPAEIPMFVGALQAGSDVVKGSRCLAGGGSADLTPTRRLGNWGLKVVANAAYNQSWSELCYGYAAFWRDTFRVLGIDRIAGPQERPQDRPSKALLGLARLGGRGPAYGHGFEIEAILFCRAARAGMRVAEVFSYEYERRHGHSNLTAWRDGLRVVTAVIRERRRDTAFVTQDTFIVSSDASADGASDTPGGVSQA